MATSKRLKIAVGSVMLSNVHPHVASSLAAMLYYYGKKRPRDSLVLITPQRIEIASARNIAIDAAIKSGCDYFFWLDDDTVCESDTLVRLVKRLEKHQDIYMISPKYYVRGYPYSLMAFNGEGNEWKLGLDESSVSPRDGLYRCKAIGNGCTLTRMSVFTSMSISFREKEWYRTGKYHTEDVYFCAKAMSVIPDFKCAIDLTFSARHLLDVGWVDADNVEYNRLKYKLVAGIVEDPKRLDEVKALVDSWNLNIKEGNIDLISLDGSLGKI